MLRPCARNVALALPANQGLFIEVAASAVAGGTATSTSDLSSMADQTYDLTNDDGAPMDYPEHEATYSMFLLMVKWGIIVNVALLVAMAAGFFMGAGLLGGVFIFIVLLIASMIFA